ncbi:hypothetical protein QR680_009303 [Steinernema hermaphroditum]|uniref:Transcription factor AP-2 C-terminal domain-containing protein n=1 Tax=Steinernema hermaphroditum TaxID=289476 RepID=A0AA39M8M5_9BILA|nr:hypothetical protein QR680_009303 [Steinernema hermaphroditum]
MISAVETADWSFFHQMAAQHPSSEAPIYPPANAQLSDALNAPKKRPFEASGAASIPAKRPRRSPEDDEGVDSEGETTTDDDDSPRSPEFLSAAPSVESSPERLKTLPPHSSSELYPLGSYFNYPSAAESFQNPYASTTQFINSQQIAYGYFYDNNLAQPSQSANVDLQSALRKTIGQQTHQKLDISPSMFPGGAGGGAILVKGPHEVYCSVPGRTSLLSNTKKHKVTIGEIQRRISPPECLNASLLGGILRRAKSKDGGKALRESLKKIGLTLPPGRRKAGNVTSWTALVEEESLQMAKDFRDIVLKDFPAKLMGETLLKGALRSEHEIQTTRATIFGAREVITTLTSIVAADRSPICASMPQMLILDTDVQKKMTHFSLLTHGFGNPAVGAVLECVQTILSEALRFIDQNYPHIAGVVTAPPMDFGQMMNFAAPDAMMNK